MPNIKRSAIGDYVHASRARYLQSSTTLYGKQNPLSPQAIYATQINKIKKEAMRERFGTTSAELQNSKKQIEKWLNMFFHPGKTRSTADHRLSEQNVEKIQKAIERYIRRHFKTAVVLNPANLSVTKVGTFDITRASEELLTQLNKFREINHLFRVDTQAIKTRITLLIKLREQVGQQGFTNQNIWNDLQQLEDDLMELDKVTKMYMDKWHTTGRYIDSFYFRYGNRGNIAEKINELVSTLQTSSQASKIIGEYGELVLKATNFVVNKKGNATIKTIYEYLEELAKATTRSQKGVKGSSVSYYAKYFSGPSALFDSKGNEIDYHTLQGDEFTVNLTEDKVDATVNITDVFDDVNLTIKNYDLTTRDEITILSGRNLLGLVQDYPDFVNHFLNIVGTHTDDEFAEKDIAYMHSAMKITAFLKAIAGGVLTKQGRNAAADMFVINDNSKAEGNYKVYFFSELLEKLINNIDLINISGYKEGIWAENEWIEATNGITNREAAAIRITRLVNVLRTMDLHVTISKKILE